MNLNEALLIGGSNHKSNKEIPVKLEVVLPSLDILGPIAGLLEQVGGKVKRAYVRPEIDIAATEWPQLVEQLAQIGYTAYGESAYWLTWDKKQMPTWEGLGEEVQRRWECATAAILSGYLGNVAYTFSGWRSEILEVLEERTTAK